MDDHGDDAMVLNAENLTKIYRIAGSKKVVLDALSLSVERGSLVSISGKSGSGKTTLLNVIAGIARPEGGSVHINGVKMRHRIDILASRMRTREIGFVFQTFQLLGDETVMSNVMLPARVRGDAGRATREYAKEILGRLRIYAYRNMKAALLSGGQKQRVAIARALVNRPALILADEPTANLDRVTAGEIAAILDDLRGEGKAVVAVTHDEEIRRRSDIVYTLTGGGLVVHSPADPADR